MRFWSWVVGVVGVFALVPEKVQSLLLLRNSSSSLQRQLRCFCPRINMSQAQKGVELTVENVMDYCAVEFRRLQCAMFCAVSVLFYCH